MTTALLRDAFAHNAWATLRVLDACSQLTPEQLATTAPGTYGSILETLQHFVGSDAYYVSVINGGPIRVIEDEDKEYDLPALRALAEETQAAWSALLETDLDPDRDVIRYRDDGSESHASLGIRLAQALQHGTDHRSQIATALTTIGIEPPEIDVWEFARSEGRLWETEPTS
jgi:uncharacterized damage-inducible protein DinB